MRTSPQRRCRPGVGFWLVASLLVAFATACSTTTVTAQRSDAPTALQPTVAPTSTPPAASPPADRAAAPSQPARPPAAPTATPHPIAVADTELPPAPIGFENLMVEEDQGALPISIEIENINVANADVIPVGVNEDLTFEVPPADQVGWYEYGSAPGEPGSAVLAAHIAYNGVDGVFRYLEDVEIGSTVVVGFDDGSSQRYRIEEITEYVKEELPDSLFARDGREQLALITCGGAFDYELDSYESNTVAIAVPI